jgi:hypothetical protein
MKLLFLLCGLARLLASACPVRRRLGTLRSLRLCGFSLTLALIAAATLAALAQEGVTKADVLRAIERFRAAPESEGGQVAAQVIVRFAKESPEVEITASPKLLPWMQATPPPKQSSLLLAAYIAGSARAQLESGKTKHDALAAEEQVIETYRKLQQTTPGLKIEAVEKLVELQKQGKLKEYLETK